MFNTHARICAVVAICLASTGCSVFSNENDDDTEVSPLVPEIEENLELSVDALDVRHGSLRIEASMTNGTSDVSMWLGESCESREVGRGFATSSGFAWSLSRDELARAIECNLLVVARGRNEDGMRVRRTTTLAVGAPLVEDGVESVKLVTAAAVGASMKMTFNAPSPARRLHVAGTIIGAEDDDEEEPPEGSFNSSFMVDDDDLALSVLGRRRITLLGEHFLATVSVANMTLDVSEPEVPVAPEPETPTEPEESYGDG